MDKGHHLLECSLLKNFRRRLIILIAKLSHQSYSTAPFKGLLLESIAIVGLNEVQYI